MTQNNNITQARGAGVKSIGKSDWIGRFRRKLIRRSVAAFFAALVLCMGTAAQAADDSPRHFEIAANPLADALMEFGAQSGLTVVASTTLTAGKQAAAVRGDLAPTVALGRLLKGSGLTFARAADGTIAIQAFAGNGPAMASDESGLDEIVVTGTFQPISKQRATTAISTIDATELSRLVPLTSLDVLSNVPGMLVDNSQGQNFQQGVSGSQLQSRGLAFIVLEEDGLPAQGAANLLGGGASTLRVDSTLDQIQVVRGGSAAITGANAPGGIINYISKTGGDVLSGTVSAMYGLQGNGTLPYRRADFDLGGPLAPGGWYFNIGGYYQQDDGAWGSGDDGDFGGQLKANIVKTLDNGSLQLYVKYLNDHNGWNSNAQWPAVDWNSPRPAPGWNNTSIGIPTPATFDVRTGPTSYATFQGSDLVHTESAAVGFKFDLDLGAGWTISNNVRFTRSSQDWSTDAYGIESGLNDFFLYSSLGTYGIPGVYTFRDSPTGASAQVRSVTGYDFTVLNNNLPGTPGIPNSVALQGPLLFQSNGRQLQDQVSVTKKLDRMSFTFGGYFIQQVSNVYSAGAGVGVSPFVPSPNLLDVTLQTPDGKMLQVTNPAGYGVPSVGVGNIPHNTWNQLALFLGHSWNFADAWNLDWGARYEYVRVNAYNNSGNDYSVTDSNSPNIYANSYYVDAPLYHTVQSIGTLAYSAAINRQIDQSNSVYLRYSLGKKSPDLGFYTNLESSTPENFQRPIPEKVVQWEMGYKLYRPSFSLDITPYYSVLTDIGESYIFTVSGSGAPSYYGAYTPANQTSDYGVEVDGKFHFDHGFALRTALTWQKSKQIHAYSWTQPNGPGPASAPLSNAVLVDANNGLPAANIPDVLAMITPSYTNGPFLAQMQWQYVGKREANDVSGWALPAYSQTNLTAQWGFTQHLKMSFIVNNLFNNLGMTEWSPPGDVFSGYLSGPTYTRAQVAANPNGVFEALWIQSRAYFLRLNYDF